MPDEYDSSSAQRPDIAAVLGAGVADPAGAPVPPPMPTTEIRPLGPAASVATNAAPAPGSVEPSPGGWSVDPYSFTRFVDAIDMVRYRLAAVAVMADRMRSASYTPKLGTSPVAAQLEEKFAERLDGEPDDPRHPTTGGLRPMLAEAMRRMEEFVAGAEDAARAYQETDSAGAANINRRGQNG